MKSELTKIPGVGKNMGGKNVANKSLSFIRNTDIIIVYTTTYWRGVQMEYITAKAAAQKWGISERRVQVLCEKEQIIGVQRLGKSWAIPKNALKPQDKRKRNSTSN